MDKNRAYLGVQTGASLLTVVVLSALSEGRLEVYYSLFTVIHFAASALYRPRRRWFDVTGGVLFLGFCYIVIMKIIEIIG